MPDAPVFARIADCSAWAYPSKRSSELMRISGNQFLEIFRWLGHTWETCSVIRQSTRLNRYDRLNQDHFESKLRWDWIDVSKSPVHPPAPSETAGQGHGPMSVLARAADHHDHGAVVEHYGADHVAQYQVSMDYWMRMFGWAPEFSYVPLLNHNGVKMSKSSEPGVLFRDIQRAGPARAWKVLSRLASDGNTDFPAVWPPRIEDQELYSFTLRWIPTPKPIDITFEHVMEILGQDRPRVLTSAFGLSIDGQSLQRKSASLV